METTVVKFLFWGTQRNGRENLMKAFQRRWQPMEETGNLGNSQTPFRIWRGVKEFQVVEIVGKWPGKYLGACPTFRRWYNLWCAWVGKIMESNGVRWGFQRQSAYNLKALCSQAMNHFLKEVLEAWRLILKWLLVGAHSKRRKKRAAIQNLLAWVSEKISCIPLSGLETGLHLSKKMLAVGDSLISEYDYHTVAL